MQYNSLTPPGTKNRSAHSATAKSPMILETRGSDGGRHCEKIKASQNPVRSKTEIHKVRAMSALAVGHNFYASFRFLQTHKNTKIVHLFSKYACKFEIALRKYCC